MSLNSLEQGFYTGDYATVVSTDVASFPDDDRIKARELQLRARICEGKAAEVAEELQGIAEPGLAIIRAYAEQVAGLSTSFEDAEKILEGSDSNTVRHFAGLIYARQGEYEAALDTLQAHEGSLECVMLSVHILLAQQRGAEAAKLVKETKKWANDHVIFNLCEAWVALRENGEQAQKAFYIFEENNGLHATARSHLGEAVAQLELRRFPEAGDSLRRAEALAPGSEDVVATAAALALAEGADAGEYRARLAPASSAVADAKEKSELFDRVLQKYQSQIPVSA